MKREYSQRDDETWIEWVKRLYKDALAQADEKGSWMELDPELLVILLNTMGTLLRQQ
jgi:hypothetical protein